MPFRFMHKFSFTEMLPILEMQRLAAEQMAVDAFENRTLLYERLMRMQSQAHKEKVIAEAETRDTAKEVEGAEESKTVQTYSLSYYNPVTDKTEVLQAKTEIKVKDIAQKVIDESVSAGTTYPIYKYIGAPIMREEIVPWKLEKILAEREYGIPPDFGGGAAVISATVIERKRKESEIVARREEEIKAAVAEAIIRKEKSELKVVEEILLLEETVDALRSGEDIDKILERLPPLSRARYILALRKKHLSREAIIEMLLRDAGFLKKLKSKLETFTLDDLLDIVKILRK